MKKNIRRELNRVTKTACVLGALSLGTYVLSGCYNEKQNSAPVKEADERLTLFYRCQNYITPQRNQTRTYKLENGNQVVVSQVQSFGASLFGTNTLNLIFGDKIQFVSYQARYDALRRDGFFFLDHIALRDGDRWELFSKEDLGENYKTWQRRYEDLAIELGKIKYSFEDKWGEIYDEEINKK